MKHHLDSDKLSAALHKRGWYKNTYGAWETAQPKSAKQTDADFAEAILESIVCPHEEHKDGTSV